MQKNRDNANMSNGLMAAPDGNEKFMSVGTSHVTGFCRAALRGCKTHIPALQDPSGIISLEKLRRDPEMGEMLSTGWEVLAVAWQAEASWPALPEFIQRVLNATNGVAAEATEMETAITISETFVAMGSTS